MKSLFIKDMFLMKKIAIFGVLYILFIGFLVSRIGGEPLIIAVVVSSYMAIQLLCHYDEISQADLLFNSLGIERVKVVLFRYISVLIYVVFFTIVYLLLYMGVKLIGFDLEIIRPSVSLIMGGITGIILLSSFFLPTYYKFGYIKTRFFNAALFISVFFIITKLDIQTLGDNQKYLKAQEQLIDSLNNIQVTLIVSIILIALYTLSAVLSVNLYKNKEF